MEIIYFIILLVLFTIFLLIKKSDKKQNILYWIAITSIILLSYNVIASYILTAVGTKCTLLNLSIFNIIITIILSLKIVKDKKVQKYYIKIKDIVAIILLLILVVIIGYKQYGTQLNIKYESTDAGVHFKAAKTFYEQKVLLYKSEPSPYYEFKTFMPTAYVNTGILFEIFSNSLDEIDMYKLYILFDLIILYLIGVVFYFAISNNIEGRAKNIIAILLSIICILGYPLNSMLWGFAYLSVGILMVVALLAVAKLLKEKEVNIIMLSIVLFLLMFGLFFSYYLFVPVVYSALGLYILFDIIKNRKEIRIFSKENIIKVIVILILPTVLGFVYFVLPGLIQSGTTSVSGISVEGYIYRDLYINFVPFAPFMLYYIIQKIKEKRNSFSVILTILLVWFILITFLGGMLQKVSSYYYYKSYFILWILAIYLTYRAFCKIMENKDTAIFVGTYLFVYIAMTILVYFGLGTIVTNRNVLFNPVEKSISMLDIQYINTAFVNRNTSIILNKQQIEGVKFINDYISEDEKEDVIVFANMLEREWVYELTGIKDSKEILSNLYECPISSIEEFIESDKKYLLYIVNDDSNLEINSESTDYSVVFTNGYSVVLEKK